MSGCFNKVLSCFGLSNASNTGNTESREGELAQLRVAAKRSFALLKEERGCSEENPRATRKVVNLTEESPKQIATSSSNTGNTESREEESDQLSAAARPAPVVTRGPVASNGPVPLHPDVAQVLDRMERELRARRAVAAAEQQAQRMELPPEQPPQQQDVFPTERATLAIGRALNIISDATASSEAQLAEVEAWVNDPERAASVTHLDLNDCGLTALPLELSKFVNLTRLNLDNNELQEVNLPPLPKLEILALVNNQLQELTLSNPEDICALHIQHNPLKKVDILALLHLEELYHSFDGVMQLPTGLEGSGIHYRPLDMTR